MTEVKTIQYTTSEGDRWDTIAFRHYGNAMDIDRLIQANPNVPISDRLPAGLVIEVPVLYDVGLSIPPSLLPPWKRNESE